VNICTFRLGSRLFGSDIHLVKEVVADARIALVPQASPDVAGLVNVRGKLHLVLDLHRMTGLERLSSPPDRVVLFKQAAGESFGVAVDTLGDVLSLPESAIEDRRADEGPDSEARTDERRRARHGIALGVGRTASGLVVLLDPRGLLPALES
jgi:purine-binding chemotaxis protein CheW